ncbi:MAG: substrate binding domain-containing protein [Bdellovibrionales bacterium]|nr:substrate binding domain-containing protein [Bdellovibrionales bacterium]
MIVSFDTISVKPRTFRYFSKFREGEIDLTGRFIDLVHDGFDLAVRLGNLEDSTLSSRKLGSLRYGLYASPKLLKQYRMDRVDQLKNVPALIFNRPDHHSEWTLVKEGTERTVQMTPRLIANNHWALRSAAIAGLGVSFSPTLLMREEVRKRRLIRVLPEWTSPEIPVHAVFPAQRYLAPKVRHFVDYLVANLKLDQTS